MGSFIEGIFGISFGWSTMELLIFIAAIQIIIAAPTIIDILLLQDNIKQ